jgi:hypothetical protein
MQCRTLGGLISIGSRATLFGLSSMSHRSKEATPSSCPAFSIEEADAAVGLFSIAMLAFLNANGDTPAQACRRPDRR